MADPLFPISHLHQGEQDRIREGQYNPYELSKLMQGENPWPTPAKDSPPTLPPEPPRAEPESPKPEPPQALNIFDVVNTIRNSEVGKFWTPRDDQRGSHKPTSENPPRPEPQPESPHSATPVADDIRSVVHSGSRLQGIFDASMPPPKPPHTEPEEFFRPNRGWFLGAAGVVAAWILDRVDAPLWLAIITLAVLLICAGIWPWIEKARKRRAWFWGLLVLYTIATVVTAIALAETSQQKPRQSSSGSLATPTASPLVTASSSPKPFSSPAPSLSPALTPQVLASPRSAVNVETTPTPQREADVLPTVSGFDGAILIKGGTPITLEALLRANGYEGSPILAVFEFNILGESPERLYWSSPKWKGLSGARYVDSDGYNAPGLTDARQFWLFTNKDVTIGTRARAR